MSATRAESERSAPLSVSGIAVTDLSALCGAVLWVGATVVGELGAIERALALAPLVLVPLGMGLAATPPFSGLAGRCYGAAVVVQPVGALVLTISLLVPERTTVAALAAAAWLPVTGLLAATAVARAANRGLRPLSETVIDAGFAYTVVGAVALVFYQLELFVWFSPVIVLLTAVHFHYAGFVLPVVTGLAGRSVDSGRAFELLAGVVLLGPAIIAVGISFSATIELVAVSVFTIAVAVLGGYIVVRVVPGRPRLQGALLSISALTLPISMLLALGFVAASVGGYDPLSLTIPRMISVHGTLNAFGFALFGLVGWRLAVPAARSGKRTIGLESE